jgi:hypothetical protein
VFENLAAYALVEGLGEFEDTAGWFPVVIRRCALRLWQPPGQCRCWCVCRADV